MPLAIRNWLLEQMHASDSFDAVVVTVKVATTEFGAQQIARRLRRLADSLERTGELPGLQLGRKSRYNDASQKR